MGKMRIIREPHRVQHFVEDLNGVPLQMILIHEGKFIMGAPESETDSKETERPPHLVQVSTFFMGRYPITNAQWNFVANLPQEQIKLGSPDSIKAQYFMANLPQEQIKLGSPDSIKKDNHPVTRVTWYDAMEFCARLSRHTGKNYRLPSEAEWEYACRAGTTTPFHFGETISTQLANYDANDTYSRKEKGDYRKKTTSVDLFKVANAFGLSDMHGNVWEWCADPWHENYDGAPKDSRVWDEDNNNYNYYYQNIPENLAELLKDVRYRVQHGGSWRSNPRNCRSSVRIRNNPSSSSINASFRVACDNAKTQ